ncbi:Tyrosine recombinase XerC [Pantoea ananatis]|uniref:Tyrosine recombinase XerC n=2 Tax=Pantoea ananas TaxID=553 RepID=A0AAJ1D223_PANAN|nr:Tyrosine recombinase XerC [Pantoea ananatis]
MRENNHSGLTIALREKQMIMNPPGLQNAPERVTALHFAPGADFATAVALRRMATANGVTPFYLLAPEVSALLYYMPDRRHHFLFSTLWNTGARIGEACTLTPESFELDGPRPFVRILSEKVRSRRGRPPKDAVRLVPLTDAGYVHQVRSWFATERPRRREPLWSVTDETMRNWLKAAVKRANDDGVHFSIPVTPHTFRHSYIMHMLYHRQPPKVIQALAGHKDARSMEVYSRVFALDVAATLSVSFSGEGAEAAAVLRSLPPG